MSQRDTAPDLTPHQIVDEASRDGRYMTGAEEVAAWTILIGGTAACGAVIWLIAVRLWA